MIAFNGDIGVILMVLGLLMWGIAVVVKGELEGLAAPGRLCLILGFVIFIIELLFRL
jgi:hypothetical protein